MIRCSFQVLVPTHVEVYGDCYYYCAEPAGTANTESARIASAEPTGTADVKKARNIISSRHSE